MKDKLAKLYTKAAENVASLADKDYKLGIDPKTVAENLKKARDKTFAVAGENLKIAGDIASENLAIAKDFAEDVAAKTSKAAKENLATAKDFAEDVAEKAEAAAKDVVDKVKETTKKDK